MNVKQHEKILHGRWHATKNAHGTQQNIQLLFLSGCVCVRRRQRRRNNIIFIIQNKHSIHCSYRIPYPLFIKCILVRYLHLSYTFILYSLHIFNGMNGACVSTGHTHVRSRVTLTLWTEWCMLNNWAYYTQSNFFQWRSGSQILTFVRFKRTIRLASNRDLQSV